MLLRVTGRFCLLGKKFFIYFNLLNFVALFLVCFMLQKLTSRQTRELVLIITRKNITGTNFPQEQELSGIGSDRGMSRRSVLEVRHCNLNFAGLRSQRAGSVSRCVRHGPCSMNRRELQNELQDWP